MENKTDGFTDKIEHVRQGAADSLESAADKVRSTAEQGLHAMDDLAQGAAKRLDATAKTVRNYSPSCALRNTIRENPGIAVGLGVAVGLFAGLALRRN